MNHQGITIFGHRCLLHRPDHQWSLRYNVHQYFPQRPAELFHEDGSAEIKRIYIRPEYRGRKLGELIVSSIEGIASEKNSWLLQLETGIHQQPAIALYRRCGYEICDAFPPYKPDPLSVFMRKELL